MSGYKERIPEVLAAFELLLNASTALDYCGITGKERKLILNDNDFIMESKKIKAGKYVEEIKDINDIVRSLKNTVDDDNARVGSVDEDPTKIINLKMKVSTMRREMLSLSADDKETDEAESLNIFFIDITREDFERMLTVEIHEGDANSMLAGDDDKESPMETAAKRKEGGKQRNAIPKELTKNTIEYVDANGDRIREEVQQ